MIKDSVKISGTPQQAASALAENIFLLTDRLLQKKEFVSLAVSGGTTPVLLFKELASKYSSKIPWEKIHFFWLDERCVPPSDEESNYGLTKEILLNKISIPSNNIHRIFGENEPEKEAFRYSREMESFLIKSIGFLVIDIVLLGMGTDGHTASIFPNQMQSFSSQKIAETAVHPSGQKRITLTGRTINNASNIFFFVIGKEKSEVISSIINNKKEFEAYPAAHVKSLSGNLTWYLDNAAASMM
jgi:6-phosphogluconolactonase